MRLAENRLYHRIIRGLIVAGLFGPVSAHGQYQTRTWLEWRTIKTEHFAVHFPADLESWARTVAGKLESVDSTVSGLTGFHPPKRIEVVIDDPFTISNGSAWPLIDAPALVLWAQPPNPREDIGNYVSWADMLTSHEFTHLAHLLRPSRNGFQTLLWKLAPVELGPISRKAPRWLIEGYATYLEGVVTQSGRPNGVWRESILRRWALEGALPTYPQLDAMGGMYGGSFAYLAGSGFIEWLVQRQGHPSLDLLWRRMSARIDRDFASAFTGVYGEPPDILYGRYASQLVADAHEVATRVSRQTADSGAMIQHLARETGDPAISVDGGRAAIMLASATRPGRIVIWKTIAEPDTMGSRAARAQLERDPKDVVAVRVFPPPKRALATLNAVGGQSFQDPRFFRDGRVLVWRNTALGDGSWMPDLYVWDPQRGTVRRITRHGNVRQGDPSPDGSRIAATRCAAGRCDLVTVDARTGGIDVLEAGNDERSFYRPRFSRDGSQILVSMRSGGFWRLAMVTLTDKSLRLLSPDRRNYFDASFADDSTIVAAADDEGVLNIERLRIDGTQVGALTAVTGAAVAPEVNPADGSVWFLSMHARGWDVRATPPINRVAAAPLVASPLRPAPIAISMTKVAEPTGYSPRRKWVYFPGLVSAREGTSLSLGFANTDPVGRVELLLQGALSTSHGSASANWQGGTAAVTLRTRVPLIASGFDVAQEGAQWRDLRGGMISGEFARRLERTSVRGVVGATASQATTTYPGQTENLAARTLAFAEAGGSLTRFHDARRTTFALSVAGAGGRHGDFGILRGMAAASISSTVIPFSLSAVLGSASTTSLAEQFTIGGPPMTMLPPGVLSQRIAMPALPPYLIGRNLQTLRFAIPLAGGQVYSWSGRAWTGPDAPRFELVTGMEWAAAIAPVSALGTPAGRISGGFGYWHHRPTIIPSFLNGPVDNQQRGALQFYVATTVGDWAR